MYIMLYSIIHIINIFFTHYILIIYLFIYLLKKHKKQKIKSSPLFWHTSISPPLLPFSLSLIFVSVCAWLYVCLSARARVACECFPTFDDEWIFGCVSLRSCFAKCLSMIFFVWWAMCCCFVCVSVPVAFAHLNEWIFGVLYIYIYIYIASCVPSF